MRFDLRILITRLVSSNYSSENKKITSLILIQRNPEIPKFICQNLEFRRKINRFSQSWRTNNELQNIVLRKGQQFLLH
jgi:hypothetical protein